ncbi:unnamed protein product [Fraxinus pennsylvanica]|uniref:F-box domain-containing protein n=1 Tax=Fraxinus pennsylvanica TaxID=56036 RepID=A0AAD2E4Q5_9LAMI|nr:unnamed protein product [Fraxinus pennsylvanica]
MGCKPNFDSPINSPSKKIKFTKHQTQTQELIPHLPQEIIEEILSRLPVKSLLKFSCVSKSWLSLISTPNFIETHLQNSSHHRILLTIDDPYTDSPDYLQNCSLHSLLYNPVTDAMNIPWDWDEFSVVVGSCNGLVCIAKRFDKLFLWNPSTRKSRRLPFSVVEMFFNDDIYEFGYFTYGFGFDESTNDYKIVKYFCYEHLTLVMIYSFKTDSWKHIEDFPGRPIKNTAKFVNGKFYWIASHLLRINIVSLDIETQRFEEIELPQLSEPDNYKHLTLGVSGECLSMLINYEKYGDLWILKERAWSKVVNIPFIVDDTKIFEQSWNKLFTIPFDISYPGIFEEWTPLYMLNNGEILLLFGTIFIVYNPKDKGLRCPIINNFTPCLKANIYVESLVSPMDMGHT